MPPTRSAPPPGARVHAFTADLSAQAQVRQLAAELLADLPHIDVLVNNAGGYWNTRHVTADGLERTFAVNHLAPFLLTALLLERIRQSHGRPRGHRRPRTRRRWAGSIFDDLQGERSYSGARAYNQSKLANVMFTHELARRLARDDGHGQRPASRSGAHLIRCRGPRACPTARWSRWCAPSCAAPTGERTRRCCSRPTPTSRTVTGQFFSSGKRTRSSARASTAPSPARCGLAGAKHSSA